MLLRIFKFLVIACCLFDPAVSFGLPEAEEGPAGDLTRSEPEGILLHAERLLDRHPDSSILFGMRALELASEQEDAAVSYRSACIIADAWYYESDLSRAIDYYRLAADYAQSAFGRGSDQYAARVSDVGFCFYTLEIFDLAAEYFNSALEVFRASGNQSGTSEQLNNLGLVYFAWGNYNLALEYFSRTLAIDMENKDSLSISISYNNVGKVYEAWGYYDTAIEHYRRSMEYLGENADEARISVRLSNIGTSYLKMEQYDLASDYLNDALAIDEQLGNARKLAVRYDEIAHVYAAKGNPDMALNYAVSALNILDTMDVKETRAKVLIDLGGYYLALGQPSRAVECLERGITIARGLGSHAILMDGYEMLSRVYEKTGQVGQALMFYRRYTELKDSVFTLQAHRQLANYRIRYETEKKARENQMLVNEVQRRKRTQRSLLVTGGLLLVSSILLIYLLREKSRSLEKTRVLHVQEKRVATLEKEMAEIEKKQLQDRVFAEKQMNRLQREKYQAEISVKGKELASSLMQLVNRNEVLAEIKKKVKGFNSAMPDRVSRDLLTYINTNADLDHTWKRFKLEFENLNPGFFDRLRNTYPDLSEQYVRLAAYLVMDLSSREIAQLMNVSIAAINKNRQRLRKKMGLEPESDLASHLKAV